MAQIVLVVEVLYCFVFRSQPALNANCQSAEINLNNSQLYKKQISTEIIELDIIFFGLCSSFGAMKHPPFSLCYMATI